MQRMVETILCDYGSLLTLQREGRCIPFRGFVHSVNSKSMQGTDRQWMPLGEMSLGQYILIAPVGTEIKAGDVVLRSGESFRVRRAEKMMYGDADLYIWGLCVKEGGEEA